MAKLAAIQKALTRAARDRKKLALTNFLEEISGPGFGSLMSRVFKAAKRFAPRTKKVRIQLKNEAGQLLNEQEIGQVYADFF